MRQLSAVETLGAVQVACVDKTGTLTVNRMTVRSVQAGGHVYESHSGRFVSARGREVSVAHVDLQWLLRVGALCSEVALEERDGVVVLQGSPTESALVQLALDAGVDVRELRATHPTRETRRRTQSRNYMTTLHDRPHGALLALKGRPSEVLALCGSQLREGKVVTLDDAARAAIENDNERMASQALRVLGLAYSERLDVTDERDADLVWLGLIGMQDPPRDGVASVIEKLRRAGVRTIMITGDQSGTAQAIGKQVELSGNGHIEIVDSTALDQIEPEVLAALAQRADVFARVSPSHKLQIVTALQRAGLVVAMTGDGVNDGPALKAADIGIAMGGGGSAAAREIADVVLEDDDLSTLVMAIEQGRTIYDDLRKAVHFILATNLGEILYTFAAVAAGLGEPLTPMQLLWINLLTDVFPELALAVQPPEADVLARPPRDPNRPMFSRSDLARIGLEGTVLTGGALAAFLWARSTSGPGIHANTVGFTALTLAQLLHAWSSRSETHTIFDREALATTKWLPIALGGTLALQIGANLVPGLRTLLGSAPLGPRDWLVAISAAIGPFLLNETIKLALRERTRPSEVQAAVPISLLPAPAE